MTFEPLRNKFAGVCYECGRPCAPGDGIPDKGHAGSKWRVRHVQCADATGATALAPAKRVARERPVYRRKFSGINPW